MLIPNMGNVLAIMGNNAQWIAHPTDVAIPKKSQFVFNSIEIVKRKNTKFATMMRKIYCKN